MKSIVAAIMLVAAPVSAQAAGFVNGSFETGPTPGSFTTIGAVNSTDIAGWTVATGSIDYIGSYWNAQDGNRSLDMSGNSAASIFQTFDTVANQVYKVSFWLGGNPANGPEVKSLTAGAGGVSQTFLFDTTGAPPLPGMNWVKQSFSFVAGPGTSSTLTFTSNTNNAFGPALDNVSISAVPEPATWGMMILGLGLVGATLRRRSGALASA